jgi:predicted peptidase
MIPPMRPSLLLVVAGAIVFGQIVLPAQSRIRNRTLEVAEVGAILYGMSVPADSAPVGPRPLIVALHPGGDRMPGYGTRFLQQVVLPALGGLNAIAVAPDCPRQARSWNDPIAERAVMALVVQIRRENQIDARRILVTGFSMGGRGTWFMASRHADVFTGAIAIAGAAGDLPQDSLATMPTYVIHSRDDQVMPFAPAERAARELEKRGRPIVFEALSGPGHYDMGGYVEPLQRAGRWISERWGK